MPLFESGLCSTLSDVCITEPSGFPKATQLSRTKVIGTYCFTRSDLFCFVQLNSVALHNLQEFGSCTTQWLYLIFSNLCFRTNVLLPFTFIYADKYLFPCHLMFKINSSVYVGLHIYRLHFIIWMILRSLALAILSWATWKLKGIANKLDKGRNKGDKDATRVLVLVFLRRKLKEKAGDPQKLFSGEEDWMKKPNWGQRKEAVEQI